MSRAVESVSEYQSRSPAGSIFSDVQTPLAIGRAPAHVSGASAGSNWAVYEAGTDVATMSWTRSPPSDHEANSNGAPAIVVAVGATTVLREPTMTVRVKGVTAVVSPTVRGAPLGVE